MPRSYNKKSEYWVNRAKSPIANIEVKNERIATPNINYTLAGESFYESTASCGGGGMSSTGYVNQAAGSVFQNNPWPNISSQLIPWSIGVSSFAGATMGIVTIQQLYAASALFRNAIENLVEFSCSRLHIRTENKTVSDFFNEWFGRINIYKFINNWFREYYRSGDVFAYKFIGQIEKEKFGQMRSVFGAKSPKLPIRYVILNPAQVYLTSALGTNNSYVKMLSRYEIEQLKKRNTPEDKQIFDSLPDNIKVIIEQGGSFNNLYIPLEKERLLFAFYKKQDYEPLAVPMGWPLLNDFEWKMELKKIDMSISRTVEHVMLLVTTGETPSQYGGGINQNNLQSLQNIFQNQTIGRVLVADYTTKAEWLIPDIGKILGPEKYIQVDKDIADGLASILLGDGGKFANATIKANIFVERLKEGQQVFLNEFLIPEAKMICEAMGFKNIPDFEFESVDLKDDTQLHRVYLRMLELGVLTAAETFTAIDTGVLPDKINNIADQKEYKQLRDKGMYLPLVGASMQDSDGSNGRPVGTGIPKTSTKVGPIGTNGVSMKKVVDLTLKANAARERIEAILKDKHKIKELNEGQKKVAETFAKNIMVNEDTKDWLEKVPQYLANPRVMEATAAKSVDEIAAMSDLTEWESIIVYKAQVESPPESV